MLSLNVSHSFLPKTNSARAAIVMDHFGIGFEQGEHVIADGLGLPIESGALVLFTGASGSGKSSLMRETARLLQAEDRRLKSEGKEDPAAGPFSLQSSASSLVIDIDRLDLGEDLLIDSVPLPVEKALQLLSACGLGEAQLLLRTPQELSDGQRYRFRLSLAIAQSPRWIVADEFTATLDRSLAKVISFNLRRLCRRTGIGFLLATTHEDVIEDLNPNIHVHCSLDGEISVECRRQKAEDKTPNTKHETPDIKKKVSHSPTNSGSPRRPSAIGRISLGGITGLTTSG